MNISLNVEKETDPIVRYTVTLDNNFSTGAMEYASGITTTDQLFKVLLSVIDDIIATFGKPDDIVCWSPILEEPGFLAAIRERMEK